MIDAIDCSTDELRAAYDRRSTWYDRLVAAAEFRYHRRAMDWARIPSGAEVLEVACGPGRALVELARRVGDPSRVRGVDLSQGMLERARSRLAGAGLDDVVTGPADARSLPFGEGVFDLVYSAYFLDLVPFLDFPHVLGEMRRVLRPGGRLVLLNMSARTAGESGREWLYRWLPSGWTLTLLGGCRPVWMERPVGDAGFREVERSFFGGLFPSELIVARRAGIPPT